MGLSNPKNPVVHPHFPIKISVLGYTPRLDKPKCSFLSALLSTVSSKEKNAQPAAVFAPPLRFAKLLAHFVEMSKLSEARDRPIQRPSR